MPVPATVSFLKAQARILHHQVADGETAALARLRSLKELREHDDRTLVDAVKRRHALAVLARELGFRGWPDAVATLSGAAHDDFGTSLYPEGCAAYWNIWSASYEEAARLRREAGGYLLGYRRQYFVSDRHLVDHVGLRPEAAEWEAIGFDWIHPGDLGARDRLWLGVLQRRYLGR